MRGATLGTFSARRLEVVAVYDTSFQHAQVSEKPPNLEVTYLLYDVVSKGNGQGRPAEYFLFFVVWFP